MVNLTSPNGVPFLASEEALPNLLAVGFKRCEEQAAPKEDIDLTAMTRAQLLEYAAEHGVNVSSRANKATIIAAIEG